MPSSPDPHPQWEVRASGAVFSRLRELQRQASREGRGDEFLEAVRQVYQNLRNQPTSFGEPLYRLPTLRLQVRSGAVRPLFVNFAVSEDRPLVFIKGVKLLGR